ncbi:hypothetical protein KVR01_006644 [Diaporthe batatas]|uniref:uncharacterized protein n=1 Tax=Diaporthe batatas TaxID=748121 RepID=UPI001D04F458|nr:uncharacterized protein KVR01_006644 [Diaporthe batatas]KAG8163347.1 hypothetical protein KVR01_006644 [Diaporthe batatas]
MDPEDLGQFFASHWQATCQNSRSSLEPNDLKELARLNSWGALQSLLQDPANREIARVLPALSHLKTFVGVFETQLGAELDAAFFWGVLGILIQVSCESPGATRTVQRVLKSIGYKADSFNQVCCATTPVMTGQMKEACFEMHIQLLEFFIDAIKCLRGEFSDATFESLNGHCEDPLVVLEQRFLKANRDLNDAISWVEKLAQYSPPRGTIQSVSNHSPSPSRPTLLLSQTRILPGRFFDRVDVFERLDQIFERQERRTPFKAVALWGLGGVGKSSIAISYVDLKVQQKQYDAIFWANAENSASLRQSFTDFAMKLKLPGARPNSHDENLELVQEWFQSTEDAWLAVYDNVSSADILQRFWPVSNHGCAIMTTRNPSLAFDHTNDSIEVTAWDPNMGSRFLIFLLKRQIGRDLDAEGVSALELSKRLDGHALGITHMAGLIQRRSWSISDFMKFYMKNPRRAHTSELQSLWEFSFKSLDKDSRSFLGVISFLMPDSIPQSLFELREEDLPESIKFLSDEFSFWETIESLLMLSLVKRNRDTGVFSVHRMVQTQFRYFLSAEELQQAFQDTINLVHRIFPRQEEEKDQLYDQWDQCNALLQHVIFLKDCFQECYKTTVPLKATWEFCDLLIQCQRYLFEVNLLEELQAMCEVNLNAAKTLNDASHCADVTASTLSHLAQLHETLGNAEKAIELNRQGLSLRLSEEPKKLVLISGFENNLGVAYSTGNDHESALIWLEKSLSNWSKACELQGKPSYKDPVIMANIGRCLVYQGKPVEARGR